MLPSETVADIKQQATEQIPDGLLETMHGAPETLNPLRRLLE